MSVKENIMTTEGKQKILEELDYLKSVKRLEIAAELKEALSFGDISENSEYDEAKNAQARLEERIGQLETLVNSAKVVEGHEIDTKVVSVGCKVLVRDYDNKEDLEYAIVGSAESDPANNKISNESPVGAALLGLKKGQEVDISVPGGNSKYKVLKISK